MTLAPCFSLLNLNYFNNIVAQVNNVQTAAELQAITNAVMADISLLESTITSQLNALLPGAALLTIPATNPTAIVTWITSFISDVLTPLLLPIANLEAQLTAITAQVAIITTAIEAAAARLEASIHIPSVSIICEL